MPAKECLSSRINKLASERKLKEGKFQKFPSFTSFYRENHQRKDPDLMSHMVQI